MSITLPLPPMRWRIDLAYQGTNYSGWQKQPGDKTVQQTVENALSMILREPIEIVGCGRTDAGVHARQYTAHLDLHGYHVIDKIIYQLNSVLPQDISIHNISEAPDDFHARYDALERHYKFYIHFYKDPFLQNLSYYFQSNSPLDDDAMEQAANLLMKYDEFLPFCKTGSDAKHYKCQLTESAWTFSNEQAIYSIKANRFLRGMVRLIVGACLNVGLGKLSIADLARCLDMQTPLPIQWSVPPEGLFLENIKYGGDQ